MGDAKKLIKNLTNKLTGNRIIKSAAVVKREHFNVCVFCGSNSGNMQKIQDEAKKLAQGFVSNGVGMVYGGASVGIMGLLADTIMGGGGIVHGVIPQSLADREVAHKGLTELRVVTTMHERKKVMFDLSDAFLTLPGGFGTLDETFEIITWRQIGLHEKPLIMLNIDGFFTPLIEFVDKAVSAGFIKPEHRQLFQVADSAEAALQILTKR